MIPNRRLPLAGFALLLSSLALSVRADEFDASIRPLLDEYCLKCHSTAEQKGDFDLEVHASAARAEI